MDVRQLILALLQEAKSQGIAPILRTTLVKYLYLLDVYTASETRGTAISSLEWKFLHFGPFSIQAAQAMDELVAQQQITAFHGETREGDKEFVLYNIPKQHGAANLRELGISGSIQTHIHADMKRYGKDQSRLLDYVYFRTTPMIDARPGEVLDFSGCIKISPEDVKPVEMQKLRPKAIKKTRQKLQELIRERKALESVQQGPFDETYYSALSILDEEPLETGLSGTAKIKV